MTTDTPINWDCEGCDGCPFEGGEECPKFQIKKQLAAAHSELAEARGRIGKLESRVRELETYLQSYKENP